MPSICIKFNDDVYKELDYLSKVLGLSKNNVIRMLIRQEYDRYESDPVIKEAISKMFAIRDILSDNVEGQTRLY